MTPLGHCVGDVYMFGSVLMIGETRVHGFGCKCNISDTSNQLLL